MKKLKGLKFELCLVFLMTASLVDSAWAQPAPLTGWSNAVAFNINTTATGADVAGDVNGVPILVRLDSTYFDFTGTRDSGQDIRFTLNTGIATLPYQIELWEPANGRAAFWVLMDIKGDTEEQLVMHWGNATTQGVSDGHTVFDTTAGYRGVWHFDASLADATGHVNSGSLYGNSDVTGLIGNAQEFDGSKVISLGGDSTLFPESEITVSAWLKTSDTSTATTSVLRMNGYYTALQLHRDDDTTQTYPTQAHTVAWTADGPLQYSIFPWNGVFDDGHWHHFVSVYKAGEGVKIYKDGELYFSNEAVTGVFDSTRGDEGGFTVGGTAGSGETYNGLLDEIRLSGISRSADYIKLNYQNQKPGQTLVSLPIDPSCTNNFGVSVTTLEVGEASDYSILGSAGCATLFYWAKVNDTGPDTPIFSNGLALTGNSGRYEGEFTETFRFYAFEGGTWSSSDPVTLTFKDDVPDPVFTLTGPTAAWNGVEVLTLKPVIINLAEIQASAAPDLNYDWSTSGIYVLRYPDGDSLNITRSYGDGTLTVSLCIDNGGTPACDSTSFGVVVGVNDLSLLDKNNVQISEGYIQWDKPALINIWSVKGQLVFSRSGKAGDRLKLTESLQKNLIRRQHQVEVVPLK